MDIHEVIANTQDGILVLGEGGIIQYYNKAFSAILGIQLSEENKYIDIMRKTSDERNDAFHQVILDAAYHRGYLVQKQLCYYCRDGRSVFVQVSAKTLENGVVFTVTDITKLEEAKVQQRDAAMITAAMTSFLCVWVYIAKIWEILLGKNSEYAFLLTYTMLIVGAILAIVCIRHSSLSVNNMGLRVEDWKTVFLDAIIAFCIFVLACTVKLAVIWFAPETVNTQTFVDWSIFRKAKYALYPISVVGQEILARGVVQESFRIVFRGKHQRMYSLLVSSLFFGALHIHKSISYMFITPVFMFACGLIYERQKNIWGICILHYCLLITSKLLGFF